MEKEKLRFMIIDDDPVDIRLLERYLAEIPDFNIDICSLLSPENMFTELEGGDISLIFVDYVLGQETGLDVLKQLRQKGYRQPVIMLTGFGNEQLAVQTMKSGATDYLVKDDIDSKNICRAINHALQTASLQRELEEKQRLLEKLARTDGLTQLYNRRFFLELFEKEVERCHRYGISLSLLLLDLDHFKKLNDTYGHLFGDRVLETVAKEIQQSIRTCDFAGRYGGEEFVIAIPNTQLEGAGEFAERLRKNIAALAFNEAGENVHQTCSIGVAFYEQGKTAHTMLHQADNALYKAKDMGRNRVCLWEEDREKATGKD